MRCGRGVVGGGQGVTLKYGRRNGCHPWNWGARRDGHPRRWFGGDWWVRACVKNIGQLLQCFKLVVAERGKGGSRRRIFQGFEERLGGTKCGIGGGELGHGCWKNGK
jgi:hypothetical protein